MTPASASSVWLQSGSRFNRRNEDERQSHGDPRRPSWIEHSGKDAAQARAFYERVLGWTIAELPMKDGSTYHGIMVGEKPVGGFSPRPAEQGGWMTYVTVDDADARFKAALEAGATALQEPFSVPGVGRIAVFADPAGAALAVITYESQQG